MAKNIDVVKAFVHGTEEVKTKTLRIEDNKLMNYQTVIAERIVVGSDFNFFVNTTKYSNATTTIQNRLLEEIPSGAIIARFPYVRMGTQTLEGIAFQD